MKATNSNIKATPHGGVIPVLKKIKEYGVPQVIRSTLGVRVKQAKYGYDDIAIAWVLTALCGGRRLDHITKLRKHLSIIPGLKLPSHDTLGRGMKKLATEHLVHRNVTADKSAKITHVDYNDNVALNRMLIKATKRMGGLRSGHSYTLDIDATFLATQCRGAESRNEQHGKIGFTPLVCLINDMPVYISLRCGDSGSRFMLADALEVCLNLLEESGITVGRVISDAAGYSTQIIDLLEKRGVKFVMRFPVHPNMSTFNKSLDNAAWRNTEIRTANDVWECEIGEVSYKMHQKVFTRLLHKNSSHERQPLRVVALRFPTNQKLQQNTSLDERIGRRRVANNMKRLEESKRLKQPGKKYTDIHWKRIGDYTYKFFVTNDWKKSCEEIVHEYNKRGDSERKFSYMKKDFAWELPPFMWMNQNLVFLVLAALANNIFVAMRNALHKVVPSISPKWRLRTFQLEFINVACVCIDKTYVFFREDIPFDILV